MKARSQKMKCERIKYAEKFFTQLSQKLEMQYPNHFQKTHKQVDPTRVPKTNTRRKQCQLSKD